MADELKQSEMPEAIASVSYSLLTPAGFPVILTIRQPSGEKLLAVMSGLELLFAKEGYEPDKRKPFGTAKKPVETVPGRVCPMCGRPLVYFESNGLKHIKCSTQKYDWKTKTKSGCPFTEWADRPTPPPAPIQTPAPQTPVGPFEPATQAQITLIQNKFPEFYREGLSKQEALQIITNNIDK